MKLIVLIAFLALALAYSTAAASEYSDTSCRREVQRHSLNRCRSWFRSGRRQGLIMTEAEADDFEDEDDNRQAPEECCMQLRRVNEECRCPMIRHVMQQIKQEAGYGSDQPCTGRCREVMLKGKYLPAMCNMEPRSCRVSIRGQV